MTALWVPFAFPVKASGGGAVKIRHMLSIYSDEKDAALKHPEAVAFNDKSLLIAADTENGRLLRYLFQNGAIEIVPQQIKLPQLTYPIRIEVNAQGEIFALDGKTRRIVRITSEGAFIGYLEPSGLPSPASFIPRSLAIDENDNIYILDIHFGRVIVSSSSGVYKRHINFPEGYGFMSDLAIDTKGNILLIDSVNARLYKSAKDSESFSPLSETLKEFMRFPVSLAIDKKDRIYLVDRNGGSIIIIGQDGSFLGRQSKMGWKEGFLNYPSQLCINSKNEIFIADTNNNRIQIFAILE